MADVSDPEDTGGGGGEVTLAHGAGNIQESEVEEGTESVKSEVAAENQRQQVSPVLSVSPDDTSSQGLECPICLQPCVHPVELPCKHIFCFLCIKGVAMQGPHGRCAICRSNIPHNVLTHPRLKDVSQLYKHVKTTSGFEWYYEARGGGWWQYDERSIQELEKAFETGQTTCQLMIAGHLYEIDFPQMIQYRLNNRNLFRRMKRDVASAEKRGIAGIRLNQGRGGGDSSSAGDGSGSTHTNRRGRGGNSQGQSHRPSSRGQNDTSQSQPPSRPSTASGNNVIVLSDSDSDNERNGAEHVESDDPDYLEEEEDMDLGDEEELGESVDEEEEAEDELRDGARAPTRRSDRSNSSTNPTPPPNGIVNSSSRNHNSSPNSNPNGRASRGARSDRTNAGSKSNNTDTVAMTANGSGGGVGGNGSKNIQGFVEPSSSTSSPSPQLLIEGGIRTISGSNIRISPVPCATDLPPNLSLGLVGTDNNDGSSRTSSSSITTTSGLTCLLIGPGVRITVDQDNPNRDDFL